MHIIVCSNNPTIVVAASRAFEFRKPRLSVCESGLQVLAAVEAANADLLIMDMQTPGLSGWLMVSAVRELAPALPILAVSTKPEEDGRTISHKGVSFVTLSSRDSGRIEDLAAALARAEEGDGVGLSFDFCAPSAQKSGRINHVEIARV
jgi:CheY-like chemotaxis protein